MKSAILSIAFVALAAATYAQAPASTATPRIDRREANQQKRIGEGIENGSVTPREGARLEREEGKIKRDEARAKADGKVTPGERAHLSREENRVSRDIYRKKHNARHAR